MLNKFYLIFCLTNFQNNNLEKRLEMNFSQIITLATIFLGTLMIGLNFDFLLQELVLLVLWQHFFFQF